MSVSVAAVVAGVLLIVWGADRFVIGAAVIARHFGLSPLIIGLTVVGLGTSAPEMLVSGLAAWQGSAQMAIGNAIGSNIANIGLVAGVSALISPLVVRSETLRREFPIMLAVVIFAWLLLYDGTLGRLDGVILVCATVVVLAVMVWLAKSVERDDRLVDEMSDEIPSGLGARAAILMLLTGLVALLISSKAIVWGASNIAIALGVSELVVGLTIVAIGTSLPELAASVASVLKNEPEIAIGNVLGSNMFNLLPVLAMPALLGPGPFAPEVLARDYPAMMIFSMALLVMAYGFRGPGRINRYEGGLLVIGFAAYQLTLYSAAA